MKIESIEILLVCVILGFQLVVFIQTYIQIGVFKRIIPKLTHLRISRILVPVTDLEKGFSAAEILNKIEHYKNVTVKAPRNYVAAGEFSDTTIADLFEYVERTELIIIESEAKGNPVFSDILFSLNNYLIHNRNTAYDFSLIKDIVERNTDTVENDIELSISIPLYLGLMGTMIGIIIGLFNMPGLSAMADMNTNGLLLNEGISSLIGGVKIAMIGSFSGLLFTICNSGWRFKGSRSLVEARKNSFYTFIQTDLLPIMKQDLAATVESLQRNLLKFNTGFTTNLTQLSGVFDASIRSIKAQKELIDAIDKTKVSEMTEYNIAVLRQMDTSVKQFERFNGYLTNVNSLVENSQQVVGKTNELLSRTDNFKVIADSIDNRLHQSQLLFEFLSAHFKKLEEHKTFTANAVADVGHAVSSSFKDLQEHIQKSSDAVKQFTVEEIEALKKTLSESKTNLSNLGHLSHLPNVANDVSQFKNNSISRMGQLKTAMDTGLTRMDDISAQLELLNNKIGEGNNNSFIARKWRWFMGLKK